MIILHTVLVALSWLLIIAVLLPLVRNDYWIFRILEYPRYQKFLLCLTVFVALLFTGNYSETLHLFTLIALGLCLVFLVYKIWPYTFLASREMKVITATSKSNQLKIFTANVLQDNQHFDKMLAQVKRMDPDVVLLVETDKVWETAMQTLETSHPYCLKEPLDNTYGMLFYSRLPIEAGEIKYLVENDVPSLEAIVKLPSGQLVKLFGLHPKPPVPGEDNRSTAKDKELMKVAFKAKEEKLPAIVMGDLNDVAWSYVTELFRKTSSLLDPRRGRGFYSTFSANNWTMRFPLDYIFCSAHFGLIDMRRLEHNGSDHFPMFIHLGYNSTMPGMQEEPTADASEMKAAADIAAQPVAN